MEFLSLFVIGIGDDELQFMKYIFFMIGISCYFINKNLS